MRRKLVLSTQYQMNLFVETVVYVFVLY